MNLTDSKAKLAVGGAICGVVAVLLAIFGNPGNMAICIACFIRDTAGALGMHQAAVVQYARPEIIGIVLGAFIISVVTKEYRSTAGSSPMIRFVLGIIIMIGALLFLGSRRSECLRRIDWICSRNRNRNCSIKAGIQSWKSTRDK